jgi:hypothetical protein
MPNKIQNPNTKEKIPVIASLASDINLQRRV